MIRDLGPAEGFVGAAIGEPGRRTFYLEVVAGGLSRWYLCEKTQIEALARRALEVLAEAHVVADPEAVEQIFGRAVLGAEQEPEFRVGTMALRYSADGELIAIELVSVDEDDGVSFQVAPEQLQAMALRGLEVVGKGRPICERCRLPKDPDGHQCPSTNGHHTP